MDPLTLSGPVVGSVTVLVVAAGSNAKEMVTVLSPLITKARLFVLPRKSGLGPVVTMPTSVSPETLMWVSVPFPAGAGLVDNAIAWPMLLGLHQAPESA